MLKIARWPPTSRPRGEHMLSILRSPPESGADHLRVERPVNLARRAIEMEMPDIGHLRVIHPVDVLDSRIQNPHLLPEKRTDAGIAQARLAVDVARAFIRRALEDFRTASALHKMRWPQIVAEVGEKRESLRKLSSRSKRSAK